MKQSKIIGLTTLMFCISLLSNHTNAQQRASDNKSLNEKEKSIIAISSLAAKGDLAKLKTGLQKGIESGLTVNEIKEVLVHLYAYCGFPRSIRGLQTFMEVLNERKAKGINDSTGREATVTKEGNNKYEKGKKILSELTKMPAPEKLTGYAAFAPTIDSFLKEHLFADIFERDVLTYAQRELVTISVIGTIGNADPMLQSHLGISLNVGITPEQLQEFVTIIRSTAGKKEAKTAQTILDGVLISRASK
jgi:alkylhydroperoxidase/carboxymuconolactone decarboxylase family protein YurZ